MYGLPQTTEVKKQIPKKTLFAKFDLKTSQQDAFDADVARIDIVASFSPHTVPAIADGVEIKEFYVLNVQLKRKDYNPKNIELLTKMIPQNMVFALLYENEVQFAVYHTELVKSDWQNAEEAKLQVQGLNVDAVWENIVKNIGQITIEEGSTLTEQIAVNKQKDKLLEQIAILEKKMLSEKQPRRKREYFEQIKKLKNQL
jgi:hypothetical protein